MEPELAIRELEAKADEVRRRSEEMQEQIRNAYATASSRDGAVTVKVGPSGALQHIEFSPRISSMSYVQLGQTVMEVAQRAQADAARRIAEIVEPQFAGTEAMDFLTGFLPPAEEAAPRRPAEPEPDDPDDDFGGSFLR